MREAVTSTCSTGAGFWARAAVPKHIAAATIAAVEPLSFNVWTRLRIGFPLLSLLVFMGLMKGCSLRAAAFRSGDKVSARASPPRLAWSKIAAPRYFLKAGTQPGPGRAVTRSAHIGSPGYSSPVPYRGLL